MRKIIRKQDHVQTWWDEVKARKTPVMTTPSGHYTLDDMFDTFHRWCKDNVSPATADCYTRIGFQMLLLRVAEADGARSAKVSIDGKRTRVVLFERVEAAA